MKSREARSLKDRAEKSDKAEHQASVGSASGRTNRTIKCYGCGKEGHIARDCLSKDKPSADKAKISRIEELVSSDDEQTMSGKAST